VDFVKARLGGVFAAAAVREWQPSGESRNGPGSLQGYLPQSEGM
jgi:hypothetical protein